MARGGVRLALATALWLSVAGSAAAQTISGTLTGSPRESWHTAVAVEAISVDNGTIAAVVRPSGAHWSMSLGPGHYLVGGLESDSKTGTAVLADQQLVQVPGASPAATIAVAKVIGMGDIPIDAAPGSGVTDGGNASTSITVGMLPQCDTQGDTVVDRTKVGQDAIQQEKQLSDQGKTPFPIAYNPIAPTISLEGKIRLSNETAIADLKLVDPGTGEVTKHVVIRGDAADFNSDLSSFLNFVGRSVAKLDCSKRKPKPKATGPLRFSIEYAGSYIDEAADQGNFHVFDLNMKWDEVLSGTVTRGARVKAKPMKLTLSGTATTQNNVNGSSDTATCFLRPGSIPTRAGGYIDITAGSPPAGGSLVKGFRTFKAWASIPLTQANGQIGYAPGSSSLCARGDLRPLDAQSTSLPPQWDQVALAEVKGKWRTPLTRTRKASFTLTSGFTDTVQVSATITVITSGTP